MSSMDPRWCEPNFLGITSRDIRLYRGRLIRMSATLRKCPVLGSVVDDQWEDVFGCLLLFIAAWAWSLRASQCGKICRPLNTTVNYSRHSSESGNSRPGTRGMHRYRADFKWGAKILPFLPSGVSSAHVATRGLSNSGVNGRGDLLRRAESN